MLCLLRYFLSCLASAVPLGALGLSQEILVLFLSQTYPLGAPTWIQLAPMADEPQIPTTSPDLSSSLQAYIS